MAGVSFQKLHDDSYHLLLCVAGGEVAGNFADTDGQRRVTGGTLGFLVSMISSILPWSNAPSLLAALSFCACDNEGEQDWDSM